MALTYEGGNYRSKRSYVTTGAFNSVIYQYTTQLNGTTLKNEGKLTAVTTSPAGTALTVTNCPAGRILRELGMKLYPGVHPGLAVGDTFGGAVVGTTATNKYWVKVFDAQTGVRGYIDPNAPTFTVYNSDKSLEIIDAQENAGGVPTRLGQPVNTAGNVTLGGNLTLTNTFTSTGAGPLAAGSASVGTLTLNGATAVVVNTTAVATTSKIFLSRNTNAGTPANFAISAQSAGSFSVTGTASDTSTVNWLVINTV